MNLTADDYINGVKRLEKSSSWKSKTQQYVLNRLSNINKLKESVDSGTYTPGKTIDFKYNENGHTRLIKALAPNDVVLQHTIADTTLLPTIKNYIIYDTGSGLKHRGLSFTRKRFEKHLREFSKLYKNGYALIIDFSKYFDNIQNEKFISEINTLFNDEQLTNLIRRICTQYEIDVSYTDDEDIIHKLFNSLDYIKINKDKLNGSKMMRKSMGIGAPIAQIAGLLFPYMIDNYIKTVLGMKYYDVYMDDRILLFKDKSFLEQVLNYIEQEATKLGIFINHKKTKIVKIIYGFTWLKTRYIITKPGKIIKILPKDVVQREKRKLRKFSNLIEEGKMDREDAINQYKSWRNSKKGFNAYYRLKRIDDYAERMIGYERKRTSDGVNKSGNNKFEAGAFFSHFRNW